MNRTLSGATTPGQSGPGSDGNEGVLRIPQSSSISGASPSDCFLSLDTRWSRESYPSAEVASVYSTATADWTNLFWGGSGFCFFLFIFGRFFFFLFVCFSWLFFCLLLLLFFSYFLFILLFSSFCLCVFFFVGAVLFCLFLLGGFFSFFLGSFFIFVFIFVFPLFVCLFVCLFGTEELLLQQHFDDEVSFVFFSFFILYNFSFYLFVFFITPIFFFFFFC